MVDTSGQSRAVPRVSVVIPAFNAAKYLGECLDSILNQNYPNVEVVIVDDGSTDSTAKVAQSYGKRVQYVWQANSGGCSAPRNRGSAIASGDYLVFFDADDLMSPGRIRRQVDFLERNPEVPIVISNYRNFSAQGLSACSHFETCPRFTQATALKFPAGETIIGPPKGAEMLIEENFAISSAPMFRRAAFNSLGRFDETLKASEDFDLIYRTARSAPVGVMADIGFLRRLHETNMSHGWLRILSFKLASRVKLFELETDILLKARLRDAIGDFHLGFAEELARQHQPGALRHVVSALQYKRRPSFHIAIAFIKAGLSPIRALTTPLREVR